MPGPVTANRRFRPAERLSLAKQSFCAGTVADGKELARLAAFDLGPAQRDAGIKLVHRIGINIVTAQFLGNIGAQPRKAFVRLHDSL